MTCIVGIKADGYVAMGGERGASNDDMIVNLSNPKIIKNGPYLIGYAGSMEAQKMQYSFEPPTPKPDDDLDKFMHTEFLRALKDYYDEWGIDTSRDGEVSMLIAIGDRLYEHHSADLSLNQYTNQYMAIGSGSPYAIGYLHGATSMSNKEPEELVENAVKTAIKFSPTCSGQIDILTTKENNG